MAFENLFIRTQKSLQGIRLDAVISEGHQSVISKTDNPVELGADITDHAKIEPKKLRIVAMVTDTPLGFAAVGEIVDDVTNLFGTSTKENATRSTAAYNALIALQELREPIKVQTKLKAYPNLLITSISTEQNVNKSRMVELYIDLEEINITASEVFELTADQFQDGEIQEQGSPIQKKGRVEAATPDDKTQKSVLKQTGEFLFGN